MTEQLPSSPSKEQVDFGYFKKGTTTGIYSGKTLR